MENFEKKIYQDNKDQIKLLLRYLERKLKTLFHQKSELKDIFQEKLHNTEVSIDQLETQLRIAERDPLLGYDINELKTDLNILYSNKKVFIDEFEKANQDVHNHIERVDKRYRNELERLDALDKEAALKARNKRDFVEQNTIDNDSITRILKYFQDLENDEAIISSLLLIVLIKNSVIENFLNKDPKERNCLDQIEDKSFYSFAEEIIDLNNDVYLKIVFNEYGKYLSKFTKEDLIDISTTLNGLSSYSGLEDIFYEILFRISKQVCERTDCHWQESEIAFLELDKMICELIFDVAQIDDDSKVLNLYSKLNSYSLPNKENKIRSICNTKHTYFISLLRILLEDKQEFVKVTLEKDPVKEITGKYDLIIAEFPEYQVLFDGEIIENTLEFKDFDKVISCLNDGGRAIIKLNGYNDMTNPFYASKRRNEIGIRKKIVESGYLKGIISFGSRKNHLDIFDENNEPITTNQRDLQDQINYTQPFILLVLCKKNNSDRPFILHAGHDIKYDQRKMAQAFINKDIFRFSSKDSMSISLDTLKDNEYSFVSGKYLIDKISGIPLSTVLTEKKSIRKIDNGEYIYRFGYDIHNPDGISGLNSDESGDSLFKTKKWKSPCVLIDMIGANGKPFVYQIKELDKVVEIPNNFNVYDFNESIISFDNLKEFLGEETVFDQIFSFLSSGNPFLEMPYDDIFKIKIPLPLEKEAVDTLTESLIQKDQKSNTKIDSLNRKSGKSEIRVKELEQENTSLKTENILLNEKLKFIESRIDKKNTLDPIYIDLEHITATPRSNIKVIKYHLTKLFESLEPDVYKIINEKFDEIYSVDLFHEKGKLVGALEFLDKSNKEIREILKGAGTLVSLSDDILDKISLNEIDNLISSKILQYPDCNFLFKYDGLKNIPAKLHNRRVKGNLNLLNILFGALFNNARDHAFSESQSRSNNTVTVSLKVIGKYLKIIYSDNGKGFDKGYTKEQFIKFGKSSMAEKGRGKGGTEIDLIAKRLNNKGWIFDAFNDEAPVKFIFDLELV